MSGFVAAVVAMLAIAGTFYGLATVIAARRLMGAVPPAGPATWPSVDILKPLHGDEPELLANLASFVGQDYPARMSLTFGVGDAGDPSAAVVDLLAAAHPAAAMLMVVDEARHGVNRKVSNLVNMDRRASGGGAPGEVVVLADSDIRVEADYLRGVVSALLAPGVGAVSCLYRGRPAGGLWSRLSGLGIDAHFLPNAALGIAFGLAAPCFGSTIALRRSMLERIGGFDSLADKLADDYALGEAVRATGLEIVFPPLIVEHLCAESSFPELWSHDLRWARTIRAVNPGGYLGSVVTHPVGLALLAAMVAGFAPWSLVLAAGTVVVRLVVHIVLRRVFGLRPGGLLLLPLRDILSFAVFVWSFAGRSVDWRGERLDVAAGGVLAAPSEQRGDR